MKSLNIKGRLKNNINCTKYTSKPIESLISTPSFSDLTFKINDASDRDIFFSLNRVPQYCSLFYCLN